MARGGSRHEGALSDPYEMKRGVEIVYLGLADVVGVHGLDQVGPAEVEQPGIVGLGKAFFESGKIHGPKHGIGLGGPSRHGQ